MRSHHAYQKKRHRWRDPEGKFTLFVAALGAVALVIAFIRELLL